MTSSEKTFVVQLIKTLDNLAKDGKVEIKARSMGVQGDLLLFFDEEDKGIAAFPTASVIQAQEKDSSPS